ncbi:MAG: metal-dependent hydrolase [Pseudomonadales bacterium]|nr:metal-dependent hydrolase [Pseudomonadales bacterium]
MGAIMQPKATTKTPDDLTITARSVEFDYLSSMKKNKYWHSNDPVITHFFNALQATFPEGERFFIESARDTRDELPKTQLSDTLKEQIKLFIKQEAFHGREHDAWCEALEELGYKKMPAYEKELKDMRLWSRKHIAPLTRLSMTAASEHFTASIASIFLYQRPDLLENAAEPFRSLLLYHALEEVEHKAVCYDLYQEAGGGYWLRQLGMLSALLDVMRQVSKRHIYMLKEDGLWNRKNKRKARKLIWGPQGLAWALLPKLMRYLRPDFHPWETDERKALLARFGHYLDEAGIPT